MPKSSARYEVYSETLLIYESPVLIFYFYMPIGDSEVELFQKALPFRYYIYFVLSVSEKNTARGAEKRVFRLVSSRISYHCATIFVRNVR